MRSGRQRERWRNGGREPLSGSPWSWTTAPTARLTSQPALRRQTAVTGAPPAFRNAGASRAAGAAAALGRAAGPGKHLHGGARLESTWLASTDADSRVPENWLCASSNWPTPAGTWCWGPWSPIPRAWIRKSSGRWRLRHPLKSGTPMCTGPTWASGRPHTAWPEAFRKLPSSEDRVLVGRLRRRGFAVLATDTTRVMTSGRTSARAPHGFGAYLRTLGAEAAVRVSGCRARLTGRRAPGLSLSRLSFCRCRPCLWRVVCRS